MMPSRLFRLPRRAGSFALAAALVVASCGSSSDDDAATTDSTDTEQVSSLAPPDSVEVDDDTTAFGSGGEVVSSFDTAKPAVIQIVAEGARRELEGYEVFGGTGTGFFISPDGLAVTNHHVVTGAATLEVYVGGDTSTSYPASVLGVSECNDLALIQVANVSDAPYFEWLGATVEPGIDVYAAGFPLSDPEYTLTRGIVTKAEADRRALPLGSSAARAIEHDANIQPGNSGGPLIDTDGKVVAVNYQFSLPSVSMQPQFFAIEGTLAQEVTERLRDGDDESLGINSIPVADEALGLTGIWVRAVEAGSPAAEVGIRPGDLVTSLNSLPMAMDGTYQDYCDVIRTAGDRPISVEVLRTDTGEILSGELRSGRQLEVTATLASAVEEVADVADSAVPYSNFMTVIDDTQRIGVDVPVEWSAGSTEPVDFGDGVLRPLIIATPDLAGFQDGFTTPGLVLTLLEGTDDIATALDLLAPEGGCAGQMEFGYEDTKFTGNYVVYTDCGPQNAAVLTLAVTSPEVNGLVVFGVQMVTQADLQLLDRLLQSFDAV